MKIRTQVNISLVVFAVLAVLIFFFVYSSNNQLEELNTNEQIISRIERDSFDLYYLENDYITHGGTRPVEQWNIKHNELSGLFGQLTISDPSQQAVLNKMQGTHAKILETVSSLLTVAEISRGTKNATINQELKEYVTSTLTGQTQTLMFSSSELSEMVRTEHKEVYNRNILIIAFSLAALMVFVVLNYIFINRSVLRSISRLHAGTERIGSGDLDTQIDTGDTDELGDLSRAFNSMTSNLKTVLISKSELEKEIAERRLAEERLIAKNAELESAYEAIAANEEELRLLNENLDAKVRELDSFTYSVSHDLRAPLRAIHGFSKILVEEHARELPPEVQRHIAIIRENALMMGNLIDDLLEFSRTSRQSLKMQDTRPNPIISQCLSELKDEQEGRDIVITVANLPACHADPALLKRVWFNLISNALKFTRRREKAQITIGTTGEENDMVVYFIRDNGAGFNMQYAGKLFGVFQRLHSSTEFEGSGVGLALVKMIVARHGGRIWAEAEVEKGATFFFSLEKGHANEADGNG